MKKIAVPEHIVTTAVSVLQPYCPDLSPAGLIEALKRIDQPRPVAPPRKPLTRHQAAEILQVSLASVNRRIKDGTLRSYKISPRLVRIDPASVEALMQGERQTTAAVTEA